MKSVADLGELCKNLVDEGVFSESEINQKAVQVGLSGVPGSMSYNVGEIFKKGVVFVVGSATGFIGMGVLSYLIVPSGEEIPRYVVGGFGALAAGIAAVNNYSGELLSNLEKFEKNIQQ